MEPAFRLLTSRYDRLTNGTAKGIMKLSSSEPSQVQITQIELREIRLPLVHFFETSFGRTIERRIILARVRDDQGVEGWGECTAGEGPFYCEEWTDSCWETLISFLGPLVIGKKAGSAAEISGLMQRVRGNRMAKATLETACWDAESRRLGVPLWKHLGGVQEEIPCGVSIGIQDSLGQLIDKIETELSAGYQRIKLKIKPGWDVEIMREIRRRFPDILLMGDANSAYTLADADVFRQMDSLNLIMFEQPLAYDDMLDHAKLQSQIRTPVCLDESIRSADDARKAIELNACKIINVKLGRVGGHSEAQKVEEITREANIPVWCGGMLESGIGRAHNIAMATLPNFTLPGDVSASARYWEEDIIVPPVYVSKNGTIKAPEGPGIGFEVNFSRIEALTVRHETIRA
jgi:o-succinylbenzoate synthase